MTSQLLARMKDPDSSLPYIIPDGTSAFDALVTSIALQLLASCLTFLPTSSASLLPLFQQRTSKKFVTALHAHALYRFAPAAGHQARAPSESSPWPALYMGPEPEAVLAEALSQRRRSAKRSSEYIPSFAASGWVDGANEASGRRQRRGSSSSSSNGVFKRLTCQPSAPQDPNRRHNTVFSRIMLCDRTKRDRDLSIRTPRAITQQKIVTQVVQRIPSIKRLGRTQSNPRGIPISSLRHSIPDASPGKVRRASSDPSGGSRLRYAFDIPEIRRVSAAPNASHKANRSLSTRGVDRGDMIASQDYVTENPEERRPSISAVNISSHIPASTEGLSPFSAPQLENDDGSFNMATPYLLQDDGHDEQTADEAQPRFSVVSYDEPEPPSARKPLSTHRSDHNDKLDLDQNGQTAADGYKDAMYGTETGHNS